MLRAAALLVTLCALVLSAFGDITYLSATLGER